MTNFFETDPHIYIARSHRSLFLDVSRPPEGTNPVIFDFLKGLAGSITYKNLSPLQRLLLEQYYTTDYSFSEALERATDKTDIGEKIKRAIDLMYNGIIVLDGSLPKHERLKKEELTRAGILKTQDTIFKETKEYPSARLRKKR